MEEVEQSQSAQARTSGSLFHTWQVPLSIDQSQASPGDDLHSLAFRVMRLCQPDLPAEHVYGLDIQRDFLQDDQAIHAQPLSVQVCGCIDQHRHCYVPVNVALTPVTYQ